MERVICIVAVVVLFSGCIRAQNKNKSKEELSFREMVDQIPIKHFEEFELSKATDQGDDFLITKELIDTYTKYDSTKEFESFVSTSDVQDGYGFEIYGIQDDLICVVKQNGDNVISTTKLSFFLELNGKLEDVSNEVFSGISFSDFYKCSYSVDSLYEDCNDYYSVDFFREEESIFMRIHYAEPADYIDQTIGDINYDVTCVNYNPLYYCLEEGKFVDCTKKHGPIASDCPSLYRSFYYTIRRKFHKDSIDVSIPYFPDSTYISYDESTTSIIKKEITREYAIIEFTQNNQAYFFEVKRRKQESVWGLDIELSKIEGETRKEIFKGYLKRGSIWE